MPSSYKVGFLCAQSKHGVASRRKITNLVSNSDKQQKTFLQSSIVRKGITVRSFHPMKFFQSPTDQSVAAFLNFLVQAHTWPLVLLASIPSPSAVCPQAAPDTAGRVRKHSISVRRQVCVGGGGCGHSCGRVRLFWKCW